MTTLQKPISVRPDKNMAKALVALRRRGDPIPTVSDVIREAVMRMYQQDVKANGHKRSNGK